MSPFALNKNSTLKSQKEIEHLFVNGNKICDKLICLYFIKSSNGKVAFSVGKKNHPLAHKRNKIKRLMRESFRLNWLEDIISFNLLFVFVSKEAHNYSNIENSIKSLIIRLNKNQKNV